ncbi:hypothetical protein LRR18_03350 [Mangrovimonas sp. AS39]|uniref:hypothetical protein n=1 Tax=Mangrovimonas futianensis TaxID=2895523 RepID=UPI001E5B6C8B|nr:hypothetical protein [Mangrovimonas futianensis]MCF1190608.1 hypothetical protein [Mangrovimonas futianensis]MCF1194305.1 hypothetical protein [Mangrovimonas futianensis]
MKKVRYLFPILILSALALQSCKDDDCYIQVSNPVYNPETGTYSDQMSRVPCEEGNR